MDFDGIEKCIDEFIEERRFGEADQLASSELENARSKLSWENENRQKALIGIAQAKSDNSGVISGAFFLAAVFSLPTIILPIIFICISVYMAIKTINNNDYIYRMTTVVHLSGDNIEQLERGIENLDRCTRSINYAKNKADGAASPKPVSAKTSQTESVSQQLQGPIKATTLPNASNIRQESSAQNVIKEKSWAHELAALELENLKFDRSLWDSIVVASRDDINVAKATYIEKRAAMLLAKERGAPARPAEVRSPQSRPLSNPFQVAAEAVRKLNIIEVRMRVIVNPSICKESDGGGNTLLLIAASVGALAILEFLLANGSDPLHRNSAGKTAIDLVRGNLSIVDFNRDRLVKAIEAKIAEISAGRSANQAPPPQASSSGDAESRCPHCGATVRFHAHTLRCPGCFRTLFST